MSETRLVITKDGVPVEDQESALREFLKGAIGDLLAQAQSRISELESEEDGSYELIQRQSDLLTKSVNLIKGNPPEDTLWSHHDLPELVQGVVTDLLEAKLELESQARWIPVSERLPERKCVAFYKNSHGKNRTIMAEYLPRYSVETNGECDNDGVEEYNEEKDAYYYIEGWWEMIDNWPDYTMVVVHEEVTHWKHIEPPKEQQ